MASVYDLSYDMVRFKASHNSFSKAQSLDDQLRHNPAAPHVGGCRGIELDLVQEPGEWNWCVQHGGGYNNASATFSDWLKDLKAWSGNGTHDPIAVTLDLKSASGSNEDLATALDEEIVRDLGKGRVYTPCELMQGSSTLADGAETNGWPTVGKLKGRFIFIISGLESRKTSYAAFEPNKRLCFADRDYKKDAANHPKTIRGSRIVINHPVSLGATSWLQLKRWRSQKGLLIRIYGANKKSLWKIAVDRGANIISTNEIDGGKWASVGPEPFNPR